VSARYRFIAENCKQFTVKAMSAALGVSKSGYYDWRKRPVCDRARLDRIFTRILVAAFRESEGTYGAPRLRECLRGVGFGVGKERIARLMKTAGIRPVSQKTFRVKTTDSDHKLPVSANLIRRNFSAKRPNQVWVSDITYVKTQRGFVYLCVVVDLFSRRIVGWAIRDHMHASLVNSAMRMALSRRRVKPWSLIVHSDRGSQYGSRSFRRLLLKHRIMSSMSAKGDCFDNAVAESIFGTIKTERIHTREYQDLTEAKKDLFRYIEGFYNRRRLHSYLGYVSPEEFEMRAEAA